MISPFLIDEDGNKVAITGNPLLFRQVRICSTAPLIARSIICWRASSSVLRLHQCRAARASQQASACFFCLYFSFGDDLGFILFRYRKDLAHLFFGLLIIWAAAWRASSKIRSRIACNPFKMGSPFLTQVTWLTQSDIHDGKHRSQQREDRVGLNHSRQNQGFDCSSGRLATSATPEADTRP